MSLLPFNIVHLSDLHLTPGAKIGRTEVSLPGKNLHGMNEVFEGILNTDDVQNSDCILITGDITDVGDTASWKNFVKILRKTNVEEKVIVVAGNHDICDMDWKVKMSDFFDTLTDKKKKENIDRLKFHLEYIDQPSTYPWSRIVDKSNRRVLVMGIDTNHSGHSYLHDNALGKIGWDQLTKLEQILKKHSNKSDSKSYIPVKIIAMHHSPNLPRHETLVKRGIIKDSWFGARLLDKYSGQITRWTHQIPQEERRALRELCLKYRVRLMAHGHMHESMDRRVNGVRMIGAPATTQPVRSVGGKKEYQYYRYKISGVSSRLMPELMTVCL
jgi:3',5'-cyclic-AMP phosphodiesterase